MTRRMLDSAIWKNEKFGVMPPMARLLAIGIINQADDQGRGKAHPVYLRSQVFPYDDVTAGQVASMAAAEPRSAAAQEASIGLDEDRSKLYFDLVLASLSEAARRELQAMDPAKYEYQSEFARRYVAQGRVEGKAEGKAEGRAELVLRQLTLRFGPLGDDVRAWISASSIEALDAIGERLLPPHARFLLGPVWS